MVNIGVVSGQASSSDAVMLVVYVTMALGFSFLCSIAEAVLLSMTPSYIESLRDKQPKMAKILKRLKQDEVDRSLAAILTLNTIAHTVGAIGSGAKATLVFGSAYFGIFSAVMTLMILFISEIIPKTVGAAYWRKLAWPTAIFVRTLIYILYPLIIVSQKLTQFLSRNSEHKSFSRMEIIAMANAGEKAGVIEEDESRIMKNLFRLKQLQAEDIMTPRTMISALQKDISVADAVSSLTDSAFSRLPVYTEKIDDISGFVLKTELLQAQADGNEDKSISLFIRPIENVTSLTSISMLLEMFLEKNIHIALVIDEYGGTDGLVSLEDIVETLLGMEIMDEQDNIEDLRKQAREIWKKRSGYTTGIARELN